MARVDEYLAQALNDEVKYWINHNLNNYLEKPENHENQSEIEHIIDFLNSDKAPRRLQKMSYAEAREASKRWLKTLIKQGADLEEVEDVDYDVIIDFKDGFKLVKLKSELAFKREGFLMGHCVASYFNKDGSVYSLRDSRDMPHATLEIPENRDTIYQCKGKGNGPIHHKYISYILDTFTFFGFPVRESELSNLGYFRPESVGNKKQVQWFLKTFPKASTMTFNGKRFFYIGSLK